MSTKRYFRRFLPATILFLFFVLGSAQVPDRATDNRRKILSARLQAEVAQVERRLAPSESRHEAAARKYLTNLAAHKKLQLLRRSSAHLRERCFWFDEECRHIYGMTIVYLDNEIGILQERMTADREEAIAAAEEHATLQERYRYLTQTDLPIPSETQETYEIPELRGLYHCVNVEGWNPLRGVFVTGDQPMDLPFPTEATTVYRERGAVFVSLKFRDAVLQYAYTGDPVFFEGEIVPPYTAVSEKAAGNPVRPGTVIVTIVRKGRLIDPSFICRR